MQNRRFVALAFTLTALSLSAQTAPPAPPPPPWATSLGAGIALTSGNSDAKNINLTFTTAWDPKTDRTFKAEALYLRGDSNGETTVDKLSARARYDKTLSPMTFAFGEIGGLRDTLKAIDYYIAPMVGAGVYAIKNDVRTLSFDAGAGAVAERNSISGDSTSGAVKAGQAYDQKLSATSSITERLTGIWKTDDWGDAAYRFSAGVTSTLTTHSELKVAYVYDYRSRVALPTIKKGDSAFFAAFLFKF